MDTPPNPSQTGSPTDDQVFKNMSLQDPFSFNPTQAIMKMLSEDRTDKYFCILGVSRHSFLGTQGEKVTTAFGLELSDIRTLA